LLQKIQRGPAENRPKDKRFDGVSKPPASAKAKKEAL